MPGDHHIASPHAQLLDALIGDTFGPHWLFQGSLFRNSDGSWQERRGSKAYCEPAASSTLQRGISNGTKRTIRSTAASASFFGRRNAPLSLLPFAIALHRPKVRNPPGVIGRAARPYYSLCASQGLRMRITCVQQPSFCRGHRIGDDFVNQAADFDSKQERHLAFQQER